MFRLRDITPRGLYARSLLMVVLPGRPDPDADDLVLL